MKYIPFSWEEAERALHSLSEKITESGFRPDTIVGMSRGGLVPARVFSDLLDVPDLRVLSVSFYTRPGETKKEPRVLHSLPGEIEGKNVLLADDISDSGKSFITAREHLLPMNPASLKTASIHLKEGSSFTPDFFFAKNTKWIVYPWEKAEFTRQTGISPVKK
jgi:hypoxanthine phosphoribosyltransferase